MDKTFKEVNVCLSFSFFFLLAVKSTTTDLMIPVGGRRSLLHNLYKTKNTRVLDDEK